MVQAAMDWWSPGGGVLDQILFGQGRACHQGFKNIPVPYTNFS